MTLTVEKLRQARDAMMAMRVEEDPIMVLPERYQGKRGDKRFAADLGVTRKSLCKSMKRNRRRERAGAP